MTEQTPLDRAHAAMQADPQDDAARLRFYDRLADNELFLLLRSEAQGDKVDPDAFDLSDVTYVLAFDREERLTAFAERPAPFVALSGRVLAAMLAEAGLGLALNLEVAPSSHLIPPDAVSWLAGTLGQAPDRVEARLTAFEGPAGLPAALLTALDQKLAGATGLAQAAWLAAVVYDTGARGHILGFSGAPEAAQTALAQAVSEALTFSGLDAASLDVGFFSADDPALARLQAVGLRFDLPQPMEAEAWKPSAPGSDPDKPPKLR